MGRGASKGKKGKSTKAKGCFGSGVIARKLSANKRLKESEARKKQVEALMKRQATLAAIKEAAS